MVILQKDLWRWIFFFYGKENEKLRNLIKGCGAFTITWGFFHQGWSAYQKNMLYFISKSRACARNAWGNYFFAMKELMRWSQGSVLFKIHGVKNLYNLIFLPCFEIFRGKVPMDSIQWISLLKQADLNFAYKTRNILHYWSVCSLSWFHKFVQPDEKPNKFTWLYRQSRADKKFLI